MTNCKTQKAPGFAVRLALAASLAAASNFPVVAADVDEAAIRERVAPEGKLNIVEPKAPAAAPEPAPATAPAQPAAGDIESSAKTTAAAPAGEIDGSAVYNQVCVACHAAGVAGAPKLGDAVLWNERIAKGNEELMKKLG